MSRVHDRATLLRGATFILCGLAFIALIAWLNRFPRGMIFAGGDVTQYFNRSFVEANLRHIWSDVVVGEGYFSPSFLYYPFYAAVFAISDLAGLDPSGESMVYMCLLWGSAYVGWLAASSLLRGGWVIFTAEANLAALIYALNPYTFYAFYFIWGYSPFLFLYAVFPVVAATTLRYFSEHDSARSAWLLVVLFFGHIVASIAYANLPFFVGMNVVLGAIVCIEWLLDREQARVLITKACAYLAVEFAAVAWAILPQVPNFLLDSNPLAEDTNFSQWILWQRLPIWQIATLNPAADRYVEDGAAIAVLALVVFIVALAAWALRRQSQMGEARPIALLCGVALIMLIESKGRDFMPAALAVWAFSNPVMGALRSNGKVVIFLPFLLLLLMSNGLSTWMRPARIAALAICLGAFLLSAYPMLSGMLQTQYSVGMKKGEDCETAQYCYLNRIPPDYMQAAAAIRRDGLDGKILSLPGSSLGSPNWTFYPEWKHIGVDPTTQLFSLPVVQINHHQDLFGYLAGREWETSGPNNPQPLLALVAELGASYVLFHRDVPRQFVHPAEEYLRSYQGLGVLVPIHTSRSLTVYRVGDAYRRPHLSSSPGATSAEGGMEAVELDSTRYVVTVPVRAGPNELIFRETFSSQWHVHVLPVTGTLAASAVARGFPWWQSFFLAVLPEASHTRFARYANRWTFDGDQFCRTYTCNAGPDGTRKASLVVEYAPQRYVYLLQVLAAIAGVAFVIRAVVVSARVRMRRRAIASDDVPVTCRPARAP